MSADLTFWTRPSISPLPEKMGDHAGRAYANICSGSVEQRRFAIANKVLAEGIAFVENTISTFTAGT